MPPPEVVLRELRLYSVRVPVKRFHYRISLKSGNPPNACCPNGTEYNSGVATADVQINIEYNSGRDIETQTVQNCEQQFMICQTLISSFLFFLSVLVRLCSNMCSYIYIYIYETAVPASYAMDRLRSPVHEFSQGVAPAKHPRQPHVATGGVYE